MHLPIPSAFGTQDAEQGLGAEGDGDIGQAS
jgi:hypothetical protein